MMHVNPMDEFKLKATNPNLGGGKLPVDKVCGDHDLVEQMQYLYVRVVKARELPSSGGGGSKDVHVEVKLGNVVCKTKVAKPSNPVWENVFVFDRPGIADSFLEVTLHSGGALGSCCFGLQEIPMRVPPDPPLAPEWHTLRDKNGVTVKPELMLAKWFGSQADEAFHGATLASAVPGAAGSPYLRSKVYLSPKLWYLRIYVIQACDLEMGRMGQGPYVKASLGKFMAQTRRGTHIMHAGFGWNEFLMFVAAEPFEDVLVLSVESGTEILGRFEIPLQHVERAVGPVRREPQWYNLQRHSGPPEKGKGFFSKILMRITLEGGYHALDEMLQYVSDLRPTEKVLWKPPVGVLEVGILKARELMPMKTVNGKGRTDAYCVAKYGNKWARTRTMVETLNPEWNEQYVWEVWDPCTVVTVAVFDNCQLEKPGAKNDSKIGKVRIRLSMLETGRVYTHSYPLLVLERDGLKRMGEVELAVRFTCVSLLNMMLLYSQPLLPKMHYLDPIASIQQDNLRFQATKIVATRMAQSDPPLRSEVVEYILETRSNMWSMRRAKAHVFRITTVFQGLVASCHWFDLTCKWKNPITTALICVLFVIFIIYPELILPLVYLYIFLAGVWYYKWRPKHPPHMDIRLSCADRAHPDELEEEFDTFPTSQPFENVRRRYDQLRSLGGRLQTILGDLANQGERVQSLMSWRDPRATALFLGFCFAAAMILCILPFQLVVVLAGFYVLRPPKLRTRLPSVPFNYFRRLPTRTDCLL